MKGKSSESDASKTNRNGDAFTNSNATGWFRSIPRRISKFISKQNNRNQSSSARLTDGVLNDILTEINVNIPHIDIDNDTNLYSMANYLAMSDESTTMSMNEEVAMIRACSQMARYGWFWGPISRQTAQQRLHGTPNGSFLVRNSQINLHNFTISFRTAGKTLHYRIEFVDGFWQTFSSKHRSIVDLIEDAMKISKENVFCYVKSSPLIPSFPVRLTNPISHFGEISSLQNMCRLVIQKSVDVGKMDMLPLPNKLISYCKEWETIYGEMPIRIGC